jgi:hypothetical protein
MLGSFRSAAKLAASPEGLSCMELIKMYYYYYYELITVPYPFTYTYSFKVLF